MIFALGVSGDFFNVVVGAGSGNDDGSSFWEDCID
jgi:hypothetical protein